MKNTIYTIGFILSFILFGGWAWALPEGTNSVIGGGDFQINGKEMIITAPDGSIFEHQSFNIAADETLRFEQPSEQARVLNRVTGSIRSQIDGRLIANGQMYLINPAGIIFGSGAVVEAARLHAVAGSLSNDDFVMKVDNFSALLGPVENAGSVDADQIVLAGSSVANSGNLKSSAGEVVLGAGGSMTLSSADGFLSVSVSTESTAPLGAATDLIGQTLLNSGIIEAQETHLLGNQITHTGLVDSEKVILSDFNQVIAASGTLKASTLSVLGAASSDPTPPSATLNSSTNQISNLALTGRLDQLKVRSSIDTVVDVEGVNRSLGYLNLQHPDIRVSGGDLDLKVSFSPVFSNQSATLVLASEKNLNLVPSLQTFGKSYQILMYGKNLQASDITALENQLQSLQASLSSLNYSSSYYDPLGTSYNYPYYGSSSSYEYQNLSNQITEIENTLSDLYALNGSSLSLDDLGQGLSAALIQKLAAENPSSSAFDLGEGQSVGIMTLEEIQLAVDTGLFANYSYYLDSSSDINPVLEAIGKSGGVSSIFGGSYAVVESVSSAEADSGNSASESDSSGEGAEESSESAEDSSDGEEGDSGSASVPSGGKSSRAVSTAQALGAVPFAPISTPVLSPAASLILEEALSPRVEMKLSNYIDR